MTTPRPDVQSIAFESKYTGVAPRCSQCVRSQKSRLHVLGIQRTIRKGAGPSIRAYQIPVLSHAATSFFQTARDQSNSGTKDEQR